jgi:hypothetical protein
MLDAQSAGIEAAQELNVHFAEVASRFLHAISESLRDDSQSRGDDR